MRGWRSQYGDLLQAGRSGNRIALVGEIFRTRPERIWGPPSFCTMVTGSLSWGVKRPGRGVDHPPHLTLCLFRPSLPVIWVKFTFTLAHI